MTIPFQPSLFAPAATGPEGLAYQPGLLTTDEEAALIAAFAGLPFEAYEFRGYSARRKVVYFGWRYVDDRKVGKLTEIPDFLLPLRDKAAAFAGLAPGALGHALINDYEPGAAIGWHRDRPAFGEVVGFSLGAPAPLRFRRPKGKGWERFTQVVEPRSAYLLRGPARSEWQHSIPPAAAQRYSVTFRTLAQK
jgi:alkylated DNA repair dioxygenase AlkB